MVEFPGGVRGMALNLEADNVGVVIFGEDAASRRATPSSAPAPSSGAGRQGAAGAWSTRWAIDRRQGPDQARRAMRSTSRRRVSCAQVGARADGDGSKASMR